MIALRSMQNDSRYGIIAIIVAMVVVFVLLLICGSSHGQEVVDATPTVKIEHRLVGLLDGFPRMVFLYSTTPHVTGEKWFQPLLPNNALHITAQVDTGLKVLPMILRGVNGSKAPGNPWGFRLYAGSLPDTGVAEIITITIPVDSIRTESGMTNPEPIIVSIRDGWAFHSK